MRRQTRKRGFLPGRDRARRHMRPRKAHSGAINAKRLKKVPTHGLGGGRTRARTWDPMIKRYLLPDNVAELHLTSIPGHGQ
jgi:hypothetical protein